MSKISERLEAYQTQMSIYAEQHKVILASDVLDMIEQLQDDLKDSIDKVVEDLEEYKNWYTSHGFNEDLNRGIIGATNHAIDIVKRGGVE